MRFRKNISIWVLLFIVVLAVLLLLQQSTIVILLLLFATLALIFYTARLLNQRSMELTAFNHLAQVVASHPTLDDLLACFYQQIQVLWQAPSFYIALYSQNKIQFPF
ncbi:MAG TPA: hypothetical protein VHP83_06015, partial [Aggregatilineaceae bacterium]|nr:hypothetical protein [Aggregatilineaceae bacterium]